MSPRFPRPRAGRAALTMIVFSVLTGALLYRFSGLGSATASVQPREVTPRGELDPDERRTIELFRRSSPAAVHVTNIGVRQNWWSADPVAVRQGTGSGFVWDDQGHVITNFHVINEGYQFQVTLADGKAYDAKAIGSSPDHDIAVLRVDAPKESLVPLAIGTSHDLLVGQKVFAIGNPFGLDQTLTTGVISGLRREIRSLTNRRITDVIQTDAAINPGNSGGPLIDSAGRVIGMNTAIVSPSGSSAGIGFAVPIDTINEIVPSLIRGTPLRRPGLGIAALRDGYQRRFGVNGVIVSEVSEGGAAERAGLRSLRQYDSGEVEFDLIVAIDSSPVRSFAELLDVLDGYKIGDEVEVTYRRDGKNLKAKLRLQPVQAAPR